MRDDRPEDPFEFIYGDSDGTIDQTELGTMGGTTTRQLSVPPKLAQELATDLDEYLGQARPTNRYLVVSDKNTGFAELANVSVVDATSETDAEAIVDAQDNPQDFGPYHTYLIDELDTPFQFYR